MKNLDARCVFFLNAQGILAQRISNACASFRFDHFSNVKNGRRSQQPYFFGRLITG